MIDANDCKAIIKHFEALHKLVSAEEPQPIFIFEIEAKIRAYKRKLIKLMQHGQ